MDEQIDTLLTNIDEDDYSIVDPFLYKLPFYSANVLAVKYSPKTCLFCKNGVTAFDIKEFSDNTPIVVDILCDEGTIVMKLEEKQDMYINKKLLDRSYVCKWYGDDEYTHFDRICKSVCDSFKVPYTPVDMHYISEDLMYISTYAKIMYCTSIYEGIPLQDIHDDDEPDEDMVKKMVLYICSS